ncbi:ATPase [Phormidesmis priestleyi ULC007]|uniref:histidine kinase n=1 Tax=Phormidesmis priestleyi ULC007 TaxID=1920490 RepID=A0A2T1DDG3_9CYAN|nr:ATP-binding sensor histidine kinase [Phormidesmis priestleyi]PSB18493.1 ATPase [Phormidesmis priestleyi ULC007]PZO48780.1 MAG: ATPase [Phormidesmis priestleyi]
MLKLSGYQVTEKIYESSKTLVYRGERSVDQKPVVIKLLKNKNSTPRELAIFRKQYILATDLNLPSIVRPYSLESSGNVLALILEDFGALSLKDYCKNHLLDLSEFLAIAIQIAQILSELHQKRVIHKDIKPANLLINPATKQVKITDFSIASLLPKETQVLTSPDGLEGTLPYMSPEQTGRMNRGVDYRTDFYSLGVTFYQLLTKRLPFEAADPLEAVHCHLARQPISPTDLDRAIPTMLSAIVLKLMAKMAEDRYQSASGLQHDLEICQQEWQLHQKITPFLLGQQDQCDRFQIPEKLYGRDAEVERLLEAFDRTTHSQNSEFMLVSGYSGIGKSSLVQEVYKPIVQRRGYFISGKFDQLQRNIPYSAIVGAFQSLMRQLLTESEARLNQWREKLTAVLGANAQVMIEVIPELEQIIGSQLPIVPLAPTEAQNRFNRVFQNFIRVFCQPEHPLVMVLDDLQWADSATLKLIKVVLTDEQTRHLLLIGAYRDNEVNSAHPFMILLEELQQCSIFPHQITLAPLTSEQVTHLIAETLHSHVTAIQPLADLVMRKTEGNPFFVNEFLKTLYQERLLRFDFNQKDWQWNIADIEAIDITDNVVELMIGKLKKLPSTTQQVLQFAACIGNCFDLKTLSTICSEPISAIAQTLVSALEGLIVPASEPEVSRIGNDASLVHFNYRFLHDRVQQAAYALIDESQKQSVHLQIGRLLFAKMTPIKRSDRVFELVGHLNVGQTLITDAAEQLELANLNLQAGKKAKSAAAYSAACEYLTQARKNLTEVAWSEHYDLTFTIHREQAEIEYLIGNGEQSKQLIDLTLTKARSVIEKTEIYRLLIVLHTLQAQYDQAIQAGRDALSLLGIDLPESNLETALNSELENAKAHLAGTQIATLINEPEMVIPEKKAAAKLLMALGAPTYFSNQDLWLIAVMKLVNLSLNYGQLPESTYGYSEYGLILGSMLGDYRSGYEFGQLSLNISERFNDQAEKCKVCLVIGGSVNHWVRPLKEDSVTFMEGYQAGLESGELQFAGYNLGHQVINSFYQGVDLESLTAKFSDYFKFAEQTNNQLVKDMLMACQLAISNLQSAKAKNFSAENLSEEQFMAGCQERSSSAGIGFYQIFKAQVLYLYDRPSEALRCIQEAEALLKYFPGCISLAEFNFYHSLTLAALYLDATSNEQGDYWQQLATNQQQMQIWAKSCPENFLHQHLLVDAELARLSGDLATAIELYDQSIAAAKANEFIQDCALANELAAKFWLTRGKEKIAQPYLVDAYYLYQGWGARAKLANLEQRYPQLLQEIHQPGRESSSIDQTFSVTHISSTSTSSSQVLDLATILKASQAISQEIEIDRLLETLMGVVLESAGAQKGTLLLQKDSELVIAAQAVSEQATITVLRSVSIALNQALPLSLVHYVTRTQKKLLIHDATIEPACATDSYILENQPKSILCFPVIYQGGLFGVLYLENNQTTHAFTRDRLQVLSLLSSQIAVSLENAALYQTLQTANAALQKSETRERERALQLEQSLQSLQQTQAQLIQTEKISSLGQLVAGVAHEVNNPVSFISGNLQHAEGYLKDLLEHLDLYQQHSTPSEIEQHREAIDLDYLLEDLPKLIASMRLGTGRIREIMSSLRTFSRVDAEKQPADLHAGLESTLLILQHRIKAQTDRPAIEVIKEYGELPLVNCYAGQLNQVFMNILANAIDAFEEVVEVKQQGLGEQPTQLKTQNSLTIQISTRLEDRFAMVAISDNGLGIPESIQERLFVPFFTTKAAGKGTGLGLSISYEIVTKNHTGQLTCVSAPEKGTMFLIKIPL